MQARRYRWSVTATTERVAHAPAPAAAAGWRPVPRRPSTYICDKRRRGGGWEKTTESRTSNISRMSEEHQKREREGEIAPISHNGNLIRCAALAASPTLISVPVTLGPKSS